MHNPYTRDQSIEDADKLMLEMAKAPVGSMHTILEMNLHQIINRRVFEELATQAMACPQAPKTPYGEKLAAEALARAEMPKTTPGGRVRSFQIIFDEPVEAPGFSLVVDTDGDVLMNAVCCDEDEDDLIERMLTGGRF